MTTSVLASIATSARCQLIPRHEGRKCPSELSIAEIMPPSCARTCAWRPQFHAQCLVTRQHVAQSVGGPGFHELASRMRLSDKWNAGFESRELKHASGEAGYFRRSNSRGARLSALVGAGSRAALWRLRISHRARGKIRRGSRHARPQSRCGPRRLRNARHRIHRPYRRARPSALRDWRGLLSSLLRRRHTGREAVIARALLLTDLSL